jgi:hypothetical protein
MSDLPSNPIRPDRTARRALFIWGAVLVISGTGIGAGGALLFKKPPLPPADAISPNPGDTGPGIPNYDPRPIVAHMTRELNLTPDQTRQVTEAYAQSLAAIKTLRSDMIVKLTAEHDKLRVAMKKTLTDEQYAQWDQHFEAMRSRMMPDAPPWHGFGHPHPGDDMRWDHGPGGGMPDMHDRQGPPGEEVDPLHFGPRGGVGGGPGGGQDGGPGGPGFDPEHRGPRFGGEEDRGGPPPQDREERPGQPEPQNGPSPQAPVTQPAQP